MRKYTWIPAGLMLLGGAALAQAATDQDPNQNTAAGQVTSDVNQSVDEGKAALRGQRSSLEMGQLQDGRDVKNSITTSATGLFLGQGVNGTWERAFSEKFSGVLGANFSRTRAADGALTSLGAQVGVDWFIIGQYNEGLRLGPRVDVGFGRNTVGADASFATIGLAGELGYNWIASNGITAGASAGLHGQTGSQINGLGTGSWFPYGSVNVGYSF
jgi:hypothetical protein